MSRPHVPLRDTNTGALTRLVIAALVTLGLAACGPDVPPPPKLPEHFLLKPVYTFNSGKRFESGLGFVVEGKDPAWPIVLTAHHVFGPEGGLEKQVKTKQLPTTVKKVSFTDALTLKENFIEDAGPMISVQGASPLEPSTDLAAMWGTAALKDHARPLSDAKPSEDAIIWLVAPNPDGGAHLHAAQVTESTSARLALRLLSPFAAHKGLDGAPLVDTRGQIVGLLLGCNGGPDKPSEVCTANPAEAIQARLEATLPKSGKPAHIEKAALAQALSVLRETRPIEPGKECKKGGVYLKWGPDKNGDSQLQLGEVASGGYLCKPDGEAHTLTYAPRPIASTARTTISRTKRLPGLTETDVLKFTADLQIKTTSEGYDIQTTISSARMRRDGKGMKDKAIDALKRLKTTRKTDKAGKTISVSGYSGFASTLSHDKRLQRFIQERLIEREEKQWKTLVERFVGRKATIGDVWFEKDPVRLPTGEQDRVRSAIIVAAEVPCGGKRCLRLHYIQNSSTRALFDALKDLTGKEHPVENVRRFKPKISISGEGERIIDPETMEVYDASFVRTFRVPMTMRDTTGRMEIFVTEEIKLRGTYKE